MINAPIKPGQLITGKFSHLNKNRRDLRIKNIEQVIQDLAHEVSILLIHKDRNLWKISKIEKDIIFFQEMLETLSNVPAWVDLPLPTKN